MTDPTPSLPPAPPALPPPACAEMNATVGGAWPRASIGAAGAPRAVRGERGQLGHLEQRFDTGRTARLRFLGSHLFDLLDKVAYEGGGDDGARRRVICAALNAVAAQGAPVLRIWGSLKRTGSPDEVKWAADILELVLDENARRERPLRFVIALLNHQAGYGAPQPDRSLDDQDPSSPWSSRRLYLEGGFQLPGHGLLADRIAMFAGRPALRSSPYVLAWELVNELDTFRSIAKGSLSGPEAAALRDTFLVPAATLLSEAFPQPIMLGDIRGAAGAYSGFARGVLYALPASVGDRLLWTSHVYGVKRDGPAGKPAPNTTWKLDLDLDIAASYGLPFVLGELGQTVSGQPARFCEDGPRHDIDDLFRAALDPAPDGPRRGAIEAVIFWGEGQCNLTVPVGAGSATLRIGAGGDSADLGPNEIDARAAVVRARGWDRFRAQ